MKEKRFEIVLDSIRIDRIDGNNSFEGKRKTSRNKESRPKWKSQGSRFGPLGRNSTIIHGRGKVGVKSRSLMVVIPPRPSLGMTLIMQHIEIGFATGTRGQSHRDLT